MSTNTPNDDKHKYTVVTSSCTRPNSALFTPTSAVYISCPTCTASTLRAAAITPGAVAIDESAGFSPVKTMTLGGGLGNAPQVTGNLTAQIAKAGSSNAPLVTASTKPVDVGTTSGVLVDVNTKAAEATNINTKTAEAPTLGMLPGLHMPC